MWGEAPGRGRTAVDEPKRTTQAARFGWFAAGHFIWSVCVCSVAWLLLAALAGSDFPPLPLWAGLTVFVIGAYFPIGAWVAARRRWSRPASRREAVLAVLLPTLVAWTWEGVAIAGMFYGEVFPALTLLSGMLLYASLALATPSVIFIFFWFTCFNPWRDDWNFWLMTALAGLLPPLLFAAGSFWRERRQGKTAD